MDSSVRINEWPLGRLQASSVRSVVGDHQTRTPSLKSLNTNAQPRNTSLTNSNKLTDITDNSERNDSICDSGLGNSIGSTFSNSSRLNSICDHDSTITDPVDSPLSFAERFGSQPIHNQHNSLEAGWQENSIDIGTQLEHMTISESQKESVRFTDADLALELEAKQIIAQLRNRTKEQKLKDLERCELFDRPHRKQAPKVPKGVYVNKDIRIPEEPELPKAFHPDEDGDT